MVLRKRVFAVWMVALTVLVLPRFGLKTGFDGQDSVPKTKLLLLVDMSFLSCSLCLQSLTEFFGVIHECGLEDSVFGIMIMNEVQDGPDVEKRRKIAGKRLKGFVIGNNIPFSFFLDEQGVFRSLNQNASATLIVLDSQKTTVARYNFPLTRAQLRAICQK